MDNMIEEELVEGLKRAINFNGTLDQVKDNVKKKLSTPQLIPRVVIESPSKKKRENPHLDDLIREYLLWTGYHDTERVFTEENCLPTMKLPRNVITNSYDIKDTPVSSELPLLLCALSRYMKRFEA